LKEVLEKYSKFCLLQRVATLYCLGGLDVCISGAVCVPCFQYQLRFPGYFTIAYVLVEIGVLTVFLMMARLQSD